MLRQQQYQHKLGITNVNVLESHIHNDQCIEKLKCLEDCEIQTDIIVNEIVLEPVELELNQLSENIEQVILESPVEKSLVSSQIEKMETVIKQKLLRKLNRKNSW